MTNKIWYEMVNIKYGEKYLTRYLALQHTLKKSFKIMTLIFSGSGILSWKYFENYTWIAFILIMIIQLLLLIENQLICSDKEIEKISSLKMMYTRYFNKLERLWTNYYYNKISKDAAIKSYFKLRKSDWENIEELDCKLSIKRYGQLMDKTEQETQNYINQYHHYE